MHTLPAGVPQRTRSRVLAVVGACAAVVLALGVGVLVDLDPQVRLDAAVSRALYAGDDRSAGLDRLLHVLTTPGVMWFRVAVFAPVVIWLVMQRRWRPLAWVLTAILLIGPLNQGLKELIGRARPAFEAGGLEYGGLSYPSGHSSGIATLVTVALVLAWPRLGPVARRTALVAGACLVVLVGLTRMWLGVHFLSDVVGGWALGIGWSLGVALLLGGLPGGPAALGRRS
ncbi:phosphatase PAP2 family protein [Blastococcus sp. URHD0036]|uniref:phosphatase PAP2 family protein n=1 Tax=Blastococcus sp. URHD0036 TaxID=1380356 RepID=UPI00068AC9A9|nr:phosphatase PAP2 family protein [Blastococcus sp. URHD0036]